MGTEIYGTPVSKLIEIKFGLECIEVRGNRLFEGLEGITCDHVEDIACLSTVDGPYVFFGSSASEIPYQAQWDEERREIWYYFPITVIDFDSVTATYIGDTEDAFEVCAVVVGDRIVSKAWTIRRNDKAAEVAVETLEEYRGRGYATRVVCEWARYQYKTFGRIPIYAHRKGNSASERTALKCGAVKFVEIVSYYYGW